jgi:hypothetical protein
MRREGNKLVFRMSELGSFDWVDVTPIGKGLNVIVPWQQGGEVEVFGRGKLLVRRLNGERHFCELWRVDRGRVRVMVSEYNAPSCPLCKLFLKGGARR